MKFDTIILDELRIGREIERFLAITNRSHWENVIKKFDQNPGITYRYFLTRRNPLIEPIKEYLDLSKRGKSIWKNKTPSIQFLAIIAFTVNNVTKNLSETAKKKFIPRLLGDDLRSVLFELKIASHFLRNNFDAEFTEYESTDDQSRTFDFFVSKDTIQGEIECKFKSFDTAKAITTDGFYLLCDEIYKLLAKTDVHCLLDISCQDKLGKSKQRFIKIAKAIESAVRNGEPKLNVDDEFYVRMHYLPNETVVRTPEQLHFLIKDYVTPKSHIASLGNNHNTLIIKIETTLEERVLSNIFDELKKASKQFSGRNAGLIACHIEGIFPNEWQQLMGDSSLAHMTYKFYERETSKHVHTIGYSSSAETLVKGNFRELQTPALVFSNPNCKFNIGQDIFKLTKMNKTNLIW